MERIQFVFGQITSNGETGLNSRKYIRSKLSATIRITPDGAPPIDAMLIDLSLHGMLIKSEKIPEVGQKCRILMLLGDSNHKFPIHANGQIIRSQGQHFAVQFDNVGLGEREELESSILLHCDDPETCIKEFALSSTIFDPLTAIYLEPHSVKVPHER